ncbi:MAG: Rrf2 family transcriptional regulator [Treponema sp.]|jgi:Rrf2 family protein|nr:Rrf2 family transcriptional regulator [Treponema sp.]
MRISTKGRYSLEAMLCMALKGGDEAQSTRQIALSTGLSEGYLEQLFIPLRRAGLIEGQRGPQGGYRLARVPARIRAGDVLRAAEGRIEPVDCVSGERLCPISASCAPRRTWEELAAAINRCVDSVSLADLARACEGADMEYAI